MSESNFKKFLELLRPIEEFNDDNIPVPPDYSDINNWAATPDINGQQFCVPNNSFVANKNNSVDVFYIHPTGFFEKKWNSDMDKSMINYWI